jgi:hypothetical protein
MIEQKKQTKGPPASLEVRFLKEGLFPEGVPLHTLSKALNAIHRLAAGPPAERGQDDVETGPFQLVSVRRGSAVYAFAGHPPEAAWDRITQAGLLIAHPEESDVPDEVIRPLSELSQIASRLQASIQIKRSGQDGILATIAPGAFTAIEQTLFIEGETEIAGTVKGVGGVGEMKCRLRVPFQKDLLYCHVAGSAVARKLGGYLYQDVIARGTATWLRKTWHVRHFKIRDVYQVRPGNLLEAMDRLREAGGSGWDDLEDPEAFLRELRGEP